MTPFERLIAESLPRPEVDRAFVDELLARILADHANLTLLQPTSRSRIRLHHVGGAMGVVVLAVGAAIGLRVRGRGAKAA